MTEGKNISWEDAVRWYRAQPGNEAAVKENYFDLPVAGAAARYAQSEEFAEVQRLLGAGSGRRILDLGAGNGVTSYALAKSGWEVVAIEPDASAEVGAGAIRLLAAETDLPIHVIRSSGENLPFKDDAFEAVHARQVLHHAIDLDVMLKEAARAVCSGGLILSTREHVADDEEQLTAFRESHPLHHLYGGENAYPLSLYLEAFEKSGLRLIKMWGPFESILNFFPGTETGRQKALRQIANRSWARSGRLLAWSETFRERQASRAVLRDRTPGRIFSFLLEKP